MYRPVLVTPPATAPISLDQAKAHLREDAADQDATITALIAAAVSYLDGWTGILGRCLITQTWRQDFDRFNRCMRLPLFPVSAIINVKYDETSGVEQTVDPANYTLLTDDLGSYVQFKYTYSFAAIAIQRPAVHVAYAAGDANADAVPQAIKTAMLLMIGHWYENRSAVISGERAAALPLPLAVDALLAPFRRIRF